MAVLFVFVFFWTLFVGGMGVISLFFGGHGGMGSTGGMGSSLFLIAIGFGPLAFIIRRGRRKQAKLGDVHARMLTAAGVAAGTGCDHAEDGTGVAINRAAKTLTLCIGEKWKAYPFTDIREWETSLQMAGGVPAVSLAALGANDRARRNANAMSGLFVTVRDIDNAKWRIAMSDTNTQARWMEILRQAISES